jgi:hypothetical protein
MSTESIIHNENISVESVALTDITQTQTDSDIVLLLIKILNDGEHANKLKSSLKISDKSIEITQALLKISPDIFKNIEKSINAIVVDGELNISDLPSIILLIKDLVNTDINNIKKDIKNLTIENIIQFIKDLLLILIEENIIKTNDKKTVEKLIDASIELLSSTINIKETIFSIFNLGCCKN